MTRKDESERTRIAHGELCYLQIPARDVDASGAFYEAVFGWRVERPHPSFEAPGVIGQWSTDIAPAATGGILGWINVDSIETALERVRANGGEVLEDPHRDGPARLLATVRDPAGNLLGVVEHRMPS